MKIFLIAIISLSFQAAWSYPQFIGKGYNNCLTCHYNPYGNGPLNDYGRAVSASALADRLFIPPTTTDEDLANSSGFLLNTPKNKWFRPSVDYRGLNLVRNFNDKDKKDSRFIHMQMEANIVLKFGKRDNFIISTSYGVIPENSSRTLEEEWFSREHYVGYRPINELGIYLGKMDKLFGIRIPDHTAYSKATTGLTQYSQTHGILFHWVKKEYEMGFHYFDGDKEKPIAEQTKGFSSKIEYNVTDNIRLGLSYLQEEDYSSQKQYLKAFLAKARVGTSSSVMTEIGQKNAEGSDGTFTTSQYIFFQNHLYLSRGLYFLTTFESFKNDINEDDEIYRIAPGIQYFPWQRVELRMDIYNEKSYSDDFVTEETWSYLGQLHLWF